MKVYGVGLPRTGTTSLSKALEILGFDSTHYCPITNPTTKHTLHDETFHAYVSSELLLDTDMSKDMWIVLHRHDWISAMNKIGQNTKKWQPHIDSFNSIKNVKQKNVLHYDISDGWEPLCKFLNKPIPKQKFPFENSSH